MLRTVSILALTAVFTAPAYAECSYGHSKATQTTAEVYTPSYAPTAASATTVEPGAVQQSTPIDEGAVVYETDAVIETVEPVVIPEG